MFSLSESETIDSKLLHTPLLFSLNSIIVAVCELEGAMELPPELLLDIIETPKWENAETIPYLFLDPTKPLAFFFVSKL